MNHAPNALPNTTLLFLSELGTSIRCTLGLWVLLLTECPQNQNVQIH